MTNVSAGLAHFKRWLAGGGNAASVSTLTATGAVAPTAGLTPNAGVPNVTNWPHVAATSGTDTTPASGTQFVTSIWVPWNMTLTGIRYLIGSVGGTDKAYAVLYSNAGAVLANSSLTTDGTLVGTAAQTQNLALTATYALIGGTRYFVGISMNGNTARLRTVPAYCSGGILGGEVAQVHGTVAAITAPSTFTADKAPIIELY